jgi:hypothetical protein
LFLPNDYVDEAEEPSGQHEQMGLPPSPFKKRFREPVQLLDKMQGSALKKTRTSGVVHSFAVSDFALCSEVQSGAALKTERAANDKLTDAIAAFGADKRGMAEGLSRLQITGLPQVFINQECADPKNEGCEANLVSCSIAPFRSHAQPLTLL